MKLFEDDGFTGTEVVFGPGDHDIGALTESGFKNDALSSLIVEKNDGTFRTSD